jgi:lipopolysaccharide transport protein LptA
LYLPIVIAEENLAFQNISIQSDQVTLDEETRQLSFRNNINIKIDNYIIKGSNALLSHEEKKLQIYGNPASIKSEMIYGEAGQFAIYPNKSMHLIGNAKLVNKGNTITSNFIKYKISSNE